MWSALRRDPAKPLCAVCDSQVFENLGTFDPKTQSVDISLPVSPNCAGCATSWGCFTRWTGLTRPVEKHIYLNGSLWAAVSTNFATAGDKTLLQSVISRLRQEKCPHRTVALSRVLPSAVEAIAARDRWWHSPLRTIVGLGVPVFSFLGAWAAWGQKVTRAEPFPKILGGNFYTKVVLWYLRGWFQTGRLFEGPSVTRRERRWSLVASFLGGACACALLLLMAKPSTANWRFCADPPPPEAAPGAGALETSAPPAEAVGSAERLNAEGLLPAETPPHQEVNDPRVTMTVERPRESEVERLGYPVAPDLVDAQHFEEHPDSVAAAVNGRIAGKHIKYKPSPHQRRKLKRLVATAKRLIFSPARIAAWLDKHQAIKDIASKKWSKETLEAALKQIAEKELGAPVSYQAKVKSEVLPRRNKAPRLVLDAGTSGQIAMLTTMACFESLLFDWFAGHSIKHKPKKDACREIFKEMDLSKGRILEGDGSAWDVRCSPGLRQQVETPLLHHIAEHLFRHGETPDVVMDWWKSDLAEREQSKRRVVYRKGRAFAKLTMDAFRASGDRGTSCLNWWVNFTCWTTVLLEAPWAVIEKPNEKIFEGVYLCFYFEGDDSLLCTSTKKTMQDIQDQWTLLGFEMKIKDCKEGDAVIFVGMTSQIRCGKAGLCVIPEPNRNIAGIAWTTSTKAGTKEKCLMGYARAMMFEDYPPLANYFMAVSRHWGGKPDGPLSREDQFKIYGDYQEGRKAPDFEVPVDCDWTPGRELVEAYTGGTMPHEAESALMGLDTIGPTDRWVSRYLPVTMLA